MTYLHIISCDSCSESTHPNSSKAALSKASDQDGWLFIRHLGKHFCASCRPSQEAKNIPAPTFSEHFERMRVQRVERQATAKRMREAGATFKEIGAALGVSPSRAAQIHEKATAVRAEPLYIKEIADMPLNERLLYPCEKLELSVRSANSLRNMGIENIGQLVQKTPSQLLEAPNFGQKSVDEIRHVLLELGLNLGSPPKN